MRRPVKKFDFLLLEPWEYCVQHYWVVMLAGIAGCIQLGSTMVRNIEASPTYEEFVSFMLEVAGVGSVHFTVFTTLWVLYAFALFLLYRWTVWRMRRRRSAFQVLLRDCEQDIRKVGTEETGLNEAIIMELLDYRAAIRASTLIAENKARVNRIAEDLSAKQTGGASMGRFEGSE